MTEKKSFKVQDGTKKQSSAKDTGVLFLDIIKKGLKRNFLEEFSDESVEISFIEKNKITRKFKFEITKELINAKAKLRKQHYFLELKKVKDEIMEMPEDSGIQEVLEKLKFIMK